MSRERPVLYVGGGVLSANATGTASFAERRICPSP